jgi:hypothetical protein
LEILEIKENRRKNEVGFAPHVSGPTALLTAQSGYRMCGHATQHRSPPLMLVTLSHMRALMLATLSHTLALPLSLHRPLTVDHPHLSPSSTTTLEKRTIVFP